MNSMETILLVLVVGLISALNFFLGAKVGQKVVRGEEVETPKISTLNPLNIYKEHQDKRKAEEKKEKIDTILKNIERYDGTEAGQEDVPM